MPLVEVTVHVAEDPGTPVLAVAEGPSVACVHVRCGSLDWAGDRDFIAEVDHIANGQACIHGRVLEARIGGRFVLYGVPAGQTVWGEELAG